MTAAAAAESGSPGLVIPFNLSVAILAGQQFSPRCVTQEEDKQTGKLMIKNKRRKCYTRGFGVVVVCVRRGGGNGHVGLQAHEGAEPPRDCSPSVCASKACKQISLRLRTNTRSG